MPNINEMRQQLYSKYPGSNWKNKVKRMGDNQVIAIWNSIKEREAKKYQEEKNQEKQLRLF